MCDMQLSEVDESWNGSMMLRQIRVLQVKYSERNSTMNVIDKQVRLCHTLVTGCVI